MSALNLKQQLQASPKALWVRMYRDRLEMRDADSKLLHSRTPTQKYDHPRSILNHFDIAEAEFKQLLTMHSLSWYDKQRLVLLEIPEHFEGGLTLIEVRALRELAYNAGAHQVWIYDHDGVCLNAEDKVVSRQALSPITGLIMVIMIIFALGIVFLLDLV